MAGVLVAVPSVAVPPAESLGITASSCLWPTRVTRVGQRRVTRLSQLLRSYSEDGRVVDPHVVHVHVHVLAAVAVAHGAVADVGSAVVVVGVRGGGRRGVVVRARGVVRVSGGAGVGGVAGVGGG